MGVTFFVNSLMIFSSNFLIKFLIKIFSLSATSLSKIEGGVKFDLLDRSHKTFFLKKFTNKLERLTWENIFSEHYFLPFKVHSVAVEQEFLPKSNRLAYLQIYTIKF
jgi:hypothetical protein